jgi:hypothetical protein
MFETSMVSEKGISFITLPLTSTIEITASFKL